LTAAVGAVAAALALVAGALSTASGPAPDVRAVTTGNHSELVKTIPITRRRRAAQRVAMSLGPGKLGPLAAGERLRMNGEVQVTLTCYKPGLPRCIGRSYSFSPRVEARLVLADGGRVASGAGTMPLSTWGGLVCSAQRPNRNHHCVVIFPRISAEVPGPGSLPCRPERCHINLVLAAENPSAEPRDRLIVGTDRPNGTVAQDKGRLNAVEIAPGASPKVDHFRTHRRRSRRLPVHENGGRRVVYSVRVPGLRANDVLAVEAGQVTDIGALPYTAYVSDEIVLARTPSAVRPASPSVAALRGYITEANGFNCTQGPSQFQTPCFSSKAGVISIRRDSVGAGGHPRALYVNLVSRTKPKHTSASPGDEARIRRGGFLSVVRYRPGGSASAPRGARTDRGRARGSPRTTARRFRRRLPAGLRVPKPAPPRGAR
jgi:hypothetical protein